MAGKFRQELGFSSFDGSVNRRCQLFADGNRVCIIAAWNSVLLLHDTLVSCFMLNPTDHRLVRLHFSVRQCDNGFVFCDSWRAAEFLPRHCSCPCVSAAACSRHLASVDGCCIPHKSLPMFLCFCHHMLPQPCVSTMLPLSGPRRTNCRVGDW